MSMTLTFYAQAVAFLAPHVVTSCVHPVKNIERMALGKLLAM